MSALFDNLPQSSASGAVAATSISYTNTGERKNFHYLEQIFDPDVHPASDLTKYVVPQEGELVFDVPNTIMYQVGHVDWQATLKSTLRPWYPIVSSEETTTEQDWIFGLRGGPMAGEALICVDYSVRPNVARVDSTVMRPGAAYAELYLGDDVSDKTSIISATYDKSGNMLNNRVPVMLAEIVDRTNLNIMTSATFSVTKNAEALSEGMRCWLIFRDEADNYIPPAQACMVQHTVYMRDHQLGVKYITSIELISPWFTNSSDPDRMLIPINISLLTVELRAIVNYSDGSQSDPLPVNGGQFSLFGLQEYRPSWPGQTCQVTLVYRLADGESFYVAEAGSPNKKSRSYTIEGSAVKGAYSPRLYTFPQWDPTLVGYRLQHFLYDLDRKTFTDVSTLVTFNDKSAVYRPSSYGILQSLIFNLNLRDVSPTYESMTFIQYTDLVLLKDINGIGARWAVTPVKDEPAYSNLFVTTINNGAQTTFTVQNGFATQDDWLAGLYWVIQPSYNSFNEEKAPAPTHFDLMHEDGRKWRFPIASWNLANAVSISLPLGQTMYLDWVNRASDGTELQLGTTGIVVTA